MILKEPYNYAIGMLLNIKIENVYQIDLMFIFTFEWESDLETSSTYYSK